MEEKKEEEVKKEEVPEEKPKLSVLEETKLMIADLKKEKEEISKIRDELNSLRSDQLLSSTAGIRQEPEKEKTKEELSKAYVKENFENLR